MLGNVVFAVVGVAGFVLFAVPSIAETQFATAAEAKALLERAVAAVKQDKAKALEMFASGAGGNSV